MGRVARYKKVKSIDPFAKARTWTEDVGNTSNIRRAKKRSKTAQKLKDQKNKKRRNNADKTNDDGFDLPPEGDDEFDMADLLGSVKRQKANCDDLLKGNNPILDNNTSAKPSSSGEKSKVEKVDTRGVKSTAKPNVSKESDKNIKNASAAKSSSKGLEITAHTPTREIIAACNNPKTQKQGADGTSSKQAKRKAFFEQKKLKKKKKHVRGEDYDEDEYDYASSSRSPPRKAPVARAAIDDQAERPPIFSSLPRGATSKKKKAAAKEKRGEKHEDDGEKADRIRKEQQALEAMRQRVMAQYAVLRESRRR